ncbi:hypothetical protein AB4Y45_36325 [Paraburkholderia sp. EG287A]|uniref:hypothetical protein n=1 Tax=unclassified Paraburkholderia TaxID=2615204 RepID=UPI0034D199EC
MEPEAISRQQSPLSTTSAPLSGAPASGETVLEEGAGDSEGDPTPAVLSRLSFCVAWLFGLEAFLAASDARARGPRA